MIQRFAYQSIPAEVENLVALPIEERLEEVQGVEEISSTSSSEISTINVEFDWGSDIARSLIDVLIIIRIFGAILWF